MRFHSILADELGVWTSGKEPNFQNVDAVYDGLLERGVQPFVELSFMPTWGAQWDEPQDDEANLDWLEQSVALLEPFRTGCYISETDFLRRPERLNFCYSAYVIGRIRRIRHDYDPRGMFRALVDLPVGSDDPSWIV